MAVVEGGFAERLKAFRVQAGLTQKQLGEKIGITESNYRNYELGKRKPKIEVVQKLASALGASVSDLYGWDEGSAALAQEVKAIEKQEKDLLQVFRGLNSEGQEKVIGYITDLSEIPKYQREE